MADVQTIINTPRETTHQRIAGALERIAQNASDDHDASNINYNNTTSGLSANKVQGAIDELALAGFVTNTVNNLVNYYLKSETYNKTEVDNLITAVKNSRFEVVPTLPTTDIKTNVIYLVPKSPTQTSNAKDEYINLDGTSSGWEKIGDTEVDLSGYVTTTALNTALSNYTTTANLTNLLNNKVDKVSGKGLSTNDYTDEEKNKLSGIEAGANKTVVDSVMSSTSTNPLQNKVITAELETSKTATGSLITLTDASNTNLIECVAEVEAVQDLHGYDHPWVGGAGKNKVDYLSCVGIGARDGTDSVYASGTTSISGKNLNINYAYENNGGILKGIKGVPVNFGEYVTISFDVVSLTGSSFFTVGIGDYNGGGTNNVRDNVAPTNNKVSVTLDAKSNYTKVGVFIQPVNANSSAVITNVQLELGQTATSYADYENICPISGWTEANVTRCGKNIATTEIYKNNYVLASDGTENYASGFIITKEIKIDSSKSCYLSMIGEQSSSSDAIRVGFYDKFLNFISRIEKSTPTPITIPNNAEYIRLSYRNIDPYFKDIQIEIGDTATTYETYKGNTYTIDLDGTRYGDKLDVVTGELRVTHGEVDLGDLSWKYDTINLNREFFYANLIPLPKRPIEATGIANGLCSSYEFASGYDVYIHSKPKSIGIPFDRPIVMINDEAYTSASDFKTAMSGVQLVYELAEPYTIQLTPQQIRLLKGTNHLSCNTGDLSIKYQPDNVIGDTIEHIEDEYGSLSDDISINSGTYNLLKVRKSYLDETVRYLKSLGYSSSYIIPTGGNNLYEDSILEGAIRIDGSSDDYGFFGMEINFYCHKSGDYAVRGSRYGDLVVNLKQGSTTVATIGGTPVYHEAGYGVQKIVSLEKGKLYRYLALIPTAEDIGDELYPMITSVENADKPYQLVIDNEYEAYQQANINDFNALSSDIDVSLSNSALPNYIAVAQNRKWLTVNNNHVPYVDGDYIVTFVIGTYRENIAFRVYGDGTGVDELSHFGSGRVFSGVRVVYGHNDEYGESRIYADSIELICDTSHTFSGNGKLSIQVIPNEKMISNYSIDGYYQGQEIECCKASEKLAYTISVTSTYSSNMFYDKNSRTRRDITNDLSNLPQAVAEQNLEKYGYKIGDYFTGASGYTYILADYNTFKGTSTPYCIASNHLGIVVDTHQTSQWYSGDASSVGYNGSTLHTYLKGTVMDNIKADMIALFGGSTGLEHLLAHSKLLTTALANWGWQANQYISALTCTQIDAGSQWTANGFQEGEASKSLELFRKYKWTEIFGSEYPWLRNLSNYSGGSDACCARNYGVLNGRDSVTYALFVVGLINFY